MSEKRFLDFTTDETPSPSNFLLESNSTNGVRKTTIEAAVTSVLNSKNINGKLSLLTGYGPQFHTNLYRGQNITAYYDSGTMSAAIANGSFDNIYVGDYIEKDITYKGTTKKMRFVVADMEYFWHAGTNTHHVVMYLDGAIGQGRMNDTDSTTGGYVASEMFTVTMPLINAALQSAFGADHVLSHKECLPTGAGQYATVNVLANLPNERMVYGAPAYGIAGWSGGSGTVKFAIFEVWRNFNKWQRWMWLRDVASATEYCDYANNDLPDRVNASRNDGSIVPYFLLV